MEAGWTAARVGRRASFSWKDSSEGGALGVSAALKTVASKLKESDEDVVGDLPKRISETKELDKCMRSPICQGKVAEEVRLRSGVSLIFWRKCTTLSDRKEHMHDGCEMVIEILATSMLQQLLGREIMR
jgi:hypothetical protein